ncbi:MAG: glutamyl-tRNA reductase [Acidobacteria bacterium]|nr:glutamyl-tRNA reductase [Acidobacteriota bacterium]
MRIEKVSSNVPDILNAFHVLGTSHQCAPVEVRERLALSLPEAGLRAKRLTESAGIREAVVLSTRLRSEFYVCDAAQGLHSRMDSFLRAHCKIEPEHFQPFFYFLNGIDAVRHLFRVASGLDSLFAGEHHARQSVGEAFEAAVAAGATGTTIERIFGAALACGRRVQTETKLGRRNLSLGRAVVELIEKIFGSLDGRTILLIGTSPTSDLAVQELQKVAAERIWVTSPDPQQGLNLAQKLAMPESFVPWDHFPQAAGLADVIIHASTSERSVLRRKDYERIRAQRQRRPLFLLDLTVPRGIDPALHSYGEVFLYNIDDMAPIAACYARRYEEEIRETEALIYRELERFLQALQKDPLSDTLLALERQLERIRQEQLAKNRSSLRDLSSAEWEDVERLTSAITRKIFCEVANELKQSAAQGEGMKISETVAMVLGLI